MEYQHWLREAINQLQEAKAHAVTLKSYWSMSLAGGELLFSPLAKRN